jgi:heat shock protein HtpX
MLAWISAGVAVVVLSYLIAFALAFACLALPFWLFWLITIENGPFLVLRLILSAFSILAGITILWSLLPRRGNFQPSGVLLDLSRERHLATEIEAIAQALNEPMPTEVYLVSDANAFVARRGGFMGFGSRRVMGIGLPLIQMLTISQFRAVLAHEFAHYYAGDTRLVPWVYTARNAILHTITNLGEKSEVLSRLTRHFIIAIPYIALLRGMRRYWKVFVRITYPICRRQEYRSDEIACHLAGSKSLIEGLQNIRRCQVAFPSYLQSILLPVVSRGYKPQVANGFLRFMGAPQVTKATSEYLQNEMDETQTDPFATHPRLRQRIEKARSYQTFVTQVSADVAEPDLYAISLLADLDTLEARLIKTIIPEIENSQLRPLAWENLGPQVYVPIWREYTAKFQPMLSKNALTSLPELVSGSPALADQVHNPPGMVLNRTQREVMPLGVLPCALALTLFDNGWTLFMQPGYLNLRCNEFILEPGSVVAKLRSGELSSKQWQTFCANAGIGDWLLAS